MRWQEQISAYIDGELSEEEHRDLEAHLASCPRCVEELRSLQRLKTLIGEKEPMKAGAFFWTRLAAALEDQQRAEMTWRGLASLTKRFVIGLTVALVLAITMSLLTGPKTEVNLQNCLLDSNIRISERTLLLQEEPPSPEDILLVLVEQ